MTCAYNQRLFSSSRLRRFYHLARFNWFQELVTLGIINTDTLLELGCFDGRLLDYCTSRPSRYVGVDANWAGGLAAARDKFQNDPSVTLVETDSPTVLSLLPPKSFDTVVTLETLEHLPPEIVETYLDEFERLTRGHFVFSVPNEKGMVFLLKYFGKKTYFGDVEPYTAVEVFNATMGRMERIERSDHKGFDYELLISEVVKRFRILSVTGLPFSWLPARFNLTVAVVAAARHLDVDSSSPNVRGRQALLGLKIGG